MAKPLRYTAQMSLVGTPLHNEILAALADRIQDSKALALRMTVDAAWGLDDGKLVPGDTVEAAIERAHAALTATAPADEAVPV